MIFSPLFESLQLFLCLAFFSYRPNLVSLILILGLPPSPPSQAEPETGLPPISSGGAAQRPIGVDLNNVSHKMSGAKIAVIALASTMSAVICLGVIWMTMLKCNGRVEAFEKAAELTHPSAPRRSTRSGNFMSFELRTEISQ